MRPRSRLIEGALRSEIGNERAGCDEPRRIGGNISEPSLFAGKSVGEGRYHTRPHLIGYATLACPVTGERSLSAFAENIQRFQDAGRQGHDREDPEPANG